MTNEEVFRRALNAHLETAAALESLSSAIGEAALALSLALAAGKKVLFCGNGGSAADAQHLAAELVGRFQKERRALPGLALHADTSALTSIANDYGFDAVYARQVDAHARPGDVLVALSTSGNSGSVVNAAERAREAGVHVIGMTGASGGLLKEFCDTWIGVPSDVTARIQECHILIGHVLCEIAEGSSAQ